MCRHSLGIKAMPQKKQKVSKDIIKHLYVGTDSTDPDKTAP